LNKDFNKNYRLTFSSPDLPGNSMAPLSNGPLDVAVGLNVFDHSSLSNSGRTRADGQSHLRATRSGMMANTPSIT
jgi:hypothetical protein